MTYELLHHKYRPQTFADLVGQEQLVICASLTTMNYPVKYNTKTMNALSEYTVIIRPDDNNTYVAYLPAISGCHAWGETPEEARRELKNVFEMIKEEYREESKILPANIEVVLANAS